MRIQITTNDLGHRQAIDSEGYLVCADCERPYKNMGLGSCCSDCQAEEECYFAQTMEDWSAIGSRP